MLSTLALKRRTKNGWEKCLGKESFLRCKVSRGRVSGMPPLRVAGQLWTGFDQIVSVLGLDIISFPVLLTPLSSFSGYFSGDIS